MDTLLTVSEAAARSGLSEIYVRLLARTGKIRARKFGTAWAIDASSLATFLATERKRGPHPLDK